jgi:endonuclease/exonuclease/phosphatase family metal-dependent hydrolase
MNTHDPAQSSNNYCASKAPYVRYLNAQQHVKFIQQQQTGGLPIYFTGDFNSKYENTPTGNIAYQNVAANLTYCILTNKGNGVINDAYDVFSKRAVTCDNKNPPGSGAGIDHVYTSKGITVSSYKAVASGTNGSDHPTMIFDTQTPGSQP